MATATKQVKQGQKGSAAPGVVAIVGGLALLGGVLLFKKTAAGKATLNGTVRSGVDNSPIAGANVTVASAMVTTAADGTFTVADLPTGSQPIAITATGFIDFSGNVDLVAGVNTQTFQLFKTIIQAGLTGVVTDINNGAPLAGVTVSVSGKTAQTASGGAYAITGLNAGTVTVTFSLSGYKTKTATINLVAGSNVLNMQMNNLGTVQGTVRDSVTSSPLSGALVATPGYQATTNANGIYNMTLPSGDRQFTCTKAGYQTQTQALTVDPEATKLLDFAMVQQFTNDGTVQGTVSNANNGNPIPGAQLTFTAPDNTPYSVSANSLGQYTITLPGSALGITYGMAVTASGFNLYSSTVLVRTGAFSTKNVPMTPVQAQVGSISGIVYDQNFAAIPGATVIVAGTSPLLQTTTDQSGFYRISNIPVGAYTIWASAQGFAQQSRNATVLAGQEIVIPYFQLSPQQQALGFYMQIDFDPTNYPTAATWYADINGFFTAWFISVNTDWNALGLDMTDPNVSGSQTLTVELYDSSYNRLVRRVVPLGGAAGPLIQNGHVYSFNVDQAHLYDLGLF